MNFTPSDNVQHRSLNICETAKDQKMPIENRLGNLTLRIPHRNAEHALVSHNRDSDLKTAYSIEFQGYQFCGIYFISGMLYDESKVKFYTREGQINSLFLRFNFKRFKASNVLLVVNSCSDLTSVAYYYLLKSGLVISDIMKTPSLYAFGWAPSPIG